MAAIKKLKDEHMFIMNHLTFFLLLSEANTENGEWGFTQTRNAHQKEKDKTGPL